jgi:2-polyprenyl-3-methyl-5-hydroxy-6-metoxy-1,4-benzoquinol methylase
MSDIPWYKSFFGEDYLHIYSPFLPAEKTAREVENITRMLNLAPGDSILDLCCGYGRHTIPLAQRGYQMTGQDLSETFLQRAQAEAAMQQVTIRWARSDMRSIPFEDEFNAIINIFTSFGYLEHEDEDQRVLQQVAKALKPNGYFLLETISQTRVTRAFSPHGIIRYNDGLIVLEERRIDLLASRNEVHISLLYPDGRRHEYQQSIRIYTLTEMIRMLTQVGLQVQAYYGTLEGSPLTMDSRLVILSKK